MNAPVGSVSGDPLPLLVAVAETVGSKEPPVVEVAKEALVVGVAAAPPPAALVVVSAPPAAAEEEEEVPPTALQRSPVRERTSGRGLVGILRKRVRVCGGLGIGSGIGGENWEDWEVRNASK